MLLQRKFLSQFLALFVLLNMQACVTASADDEMDDFELAGQSDDFADKVFADEDQSLWGKVESQIRVAGEDNSQEARRRMQAEINQWKRFFGLTVDPMDEVAAE